MSQFSVMAKPQESQTSIMLRAWRHYSQITSRVLATTVGTVALLGVPAYFIDKAVGTWPMIFGVVLVLSLPLSQFLVVKVMRDYLKNNPQ